MLIQSPSSPFQLIELVGLINDFKAVPQMITNDGLFTFVPISTRAFEIEKDQRGVLLIANKPVGDRGETYNQQKGTLRTFSCTHLPMNFQITPQELEAARQLGQQGFKTVTSEIERKLTGVRSFHLATWEHQMIGAVKGAIVDRDGSTVISNLFTEFGLTQQVTDFDFTPSSKLIPQITNTKQKSQRALGNINAARFRAYCGENWFNQFITHPDVEKAYANWEQKGGQFLATDNRGGFVFAGVEWKVYFGEVGDYKFVADDEAYLVPLGVPGMFEMYSGPVNRLSRVNQPPQQPIFLSELALGHDKGFDYETESNPFAMNSRPNAVIKLGID
jgi:hypothetical protein